MFMCALYIMPMLIPAINLLQVQTNRAYVKEIQVNQVSCASDLWSIKYLNSQDKSGKYSVRTVACYFLLISNCSGKINKTIHKLQGRSPAYHLLYYLQYEYWHKLVYKTLGYWSG